MNPNFYIVYENFGRNVKKENIFVKTKDIILFLYLNKFINIFSLGNFEPQESSPEILYEIF
jgi:hypothetical protein